MTVSAEPETTPTTLSARVADASRRYLAGDQTAMTDLVRWTTPWLFHICRGLGLSTPAAEDAVQSTLLAFMQHVPNLRDPQCALSWLTVVARREGIRLAKLERRTEPVGDMAALDRPDVEFDPQLMLDAKLLRAAVLRNLAKLPNRKRALLRLAFLAEVTDYASIARTLNMPVGSIGPTRRRSLEAMRELLDADDEWCLSA